MKRHLKFKPIVAIACIAALIIVALYAAVSPKQAQADFDADSYPPVIRETLTLDDGSAMLVSSQNPGKAWFAVDDRSYRVMDVVAAVAHKTEAGTTYAPYQNVDEAISVALEEGSIVRLLADVRSAYDFASIPGVIDADGACTLLIDIELGNYAVDFSLAELPDGYRVSLCGTIDGVSTYTLTRI